MRILLAEDDKLLGEAISAGLKQQNYVIDWLEDGISAEDTILSAENFDLIILDIGLPKRSGLEVLRNIRAEGVKTPVIILTARDTSEVQGFDSGCDDYIVKPFDFDVLNARIRALLRRAANRANPKVEFNGIVLDPAAHQVFFEGQLLDISRREFALLQKLLENVGKVLSRDRLTQTLYGWGDDIDSNALEVHIHNLRKKFGSKLIRTIRGVGYMIDEVK